jgi:integrase
MSIYKRGKSWYAEFYIRGVRYGPKSLGPIPRSVATRWETEAKAKAWQGLYEPERPIVPTFATFALEFASIYKAGHRPLSTKAVVQILRQLAPHFARYRLDEITLVMLERYTRDLASHHRPNTVNNHVDLIKQLFRHATRLGYLRVDPSLELRRVRLDEPKTRVLTPEEDARLLAACNAHMRPLVQFGLLTGLRVGELVSLTWEQIDLRRETVTVWSGGAKSRRHRTIPLIPLALDTVQNVPPGEGRIFGYRHIHSGFRLAAKRAGLKDVTPHTLRHTFASRLAEQDVNSRLIQQFLGHASLLQTQRYINPHSSYAREAILRLGSQQMSQQGELGKTRNA